jgi:hypothetical protein
MSEAYSLGEVSVDSLKECLLFLSQSYPFIDETAKEAFSAQVNALDVAANPHLSGDPTMPTIPTETPAETPAETPVEPPAQPEQPAETPVEVPAEGTAPSGVTANEVPAELAPEQPAETPAESVAEGTEGA